MMKLNYDIDGGNFTKAGLASSDVKKILKQLDVAPKLVRRIVVALYEAEVNVVAHAFAGKIFVDIDKEKIKIIVQDQGPGIANIDQAMTEGFSTASAKVREMGFGAGMGLPNIKRNTDEFSIESVVEEGTTLLMLNYLQ